MTTLIAHSRTVTLTALPKSPVTVTRSITAFQELDVLATAGGTPEPLMVVSPAGGTPSTLGLVLIYTAAIIPVLHSRARPTRLTALEK